MPITGSADDTILCRVANIYNEAAAKANKPGRIYGLEGDVRLKVCYLLMCDIMHELTRV